MASLVGRATREWVLPFGMSPRVAVLFVMAVVLFVVSVVAQSRSPSRDDAQDLPILSVHSSNDNGGRALALWLAELGYRPVPIEYRPFDVDDDVAVLFVLAPNDDLTDANVELITDWVSRGGTLVVADDRSNRLLDHLKVTVTRRFNPLVAIPRQPLFLNPPIRQVEAKALATLRPDDNTWVPVLATPDGGLIAAVAEVGQGRVFVLSSTFALSNAGLGRADNWALVTNIMADVPPGSVVAFDEYHHGLTEHGTLLNRLLTEPWGWALIFTAAAVFAYTALRGRRFGRAVVAAAERGRRSRSEYVATIAALLRQGGPTDWLCQQYVAQVKRTLGTRFRIQTDLSARDFVDHLLERRPEAEGLAAPLDALERGRDIGVAQAISLMRQVDTVCRRLVAS